MQPRTTEEKQREREKKRMTPRASSSHQNLIKNNLQSGTFRVLDELPERRRDVALRRALDLDDGLGLGMVALGFAARERRRGHGVLFGFEKKQKKLLRPARLAFIWLSLSLVFQLHSLSLSLSPTLFLSPAKSAIIEEEEEHTSSSSALNSLLITHIVGTKNGV